MRRGVFISFEGVDGCGKSTHARMLAAQLRGAGLDVLEVRDPGSVALSEAIRQLLLDPANGALTAHAELLLYEAARAQLVDERIAPALAQGRVVVSDRFFDSTTAYQGAGRGLSSADIQRANALGSRGLVPDRTILLDVAVSEALDRGAGEKDRMELEGEDFLSAVREAYVCIAQKDPLRVRMIDGALPKDTVSTLIFQEVADLFDCLSCESAGDGP